VFVGDAHSPAFGAVAGVVLVSFLGKGDIEINTMEGLRIFERWRVSAFANVVRSKAQADETCVALMTEESAKI